LKNVLVTGGAGFIGFHLAENFSDGDYHIDLVDNLLRGMKDDELEALCKMPNVRFIESDLLDPESLSHLNKDYEFIYHFAAIIGVSNVLERPYKVLRDNVAMTVNMLEFAKDQTRLDRFVFASTSEVYAGTLKHFELSIPTPEYVPLAINDLSYARTSYMLSKIYGEALCHQSGIPFTIIRPHNIYGPRMGMSHVIPELLKKAHTAGQGDQLEVFSTDHRRTFCYVEDAVNMIKLCVEIPDCENETLNIGCQSPEITMGDLAAIIIDVVGKDLIQKALPPTPGSPIRRCPDMNKTTRLTGYIPQVTLQQGIKKSYSWYRHQIFNGNGVSAK